MATVLVTGAAGFIGRSVLTLLVRKEYSVLALDNFSFSNESQVPRDPSIRWVNGDTRDFALMRELVQASDFIIHLAAPSSFIMHEENDLDACNFTMMGFKTLMEAMRVEGKKRLVWTSTSAVYEEPGKEFEPRVPFHEGLVLNPPDSKAGCKHWCEMEAQRYTDRYGFTCIGFRPFSVYGEGEHTKEGYANITSLFVWAMANGHQPIIWDDGSQTRDFIYVLDVARALVMAMEKEDLKTVNLNLGFGKEHTFLEAGAIIAQELGVSFEPLFDAVRIQIYARRLWADMTLAKARLGFEAEIPYEEGVRRVIAAYRNLSEEDRLSHNLAMQQHYYEKLPHTRASS